MKKSLSAFDLVAFGIGATIGSGIFALTRNRGCRTGSHRKRLSHPPPVINFILGSPLGREGAGPAVVISFTIAKRHRLRFCGHVLCRIGGDDSRIGLCLYVLPKPLWASSSPGSSAGI